MIPNQYLTILVKQPRNLFVKMTYQNERQQIWMTWEKFRLYWTWLKWFVKDRIQNIESKVQILQTPSASCHSSSPTWLHLLPIGNDRPRLTISLTDLWSIVFDNEKYSSNFKSYWLHWMGEIAIGLPLRPTVWLLQHPVAGGMIYCSNSSFKSNWLYWVFGWEGLQ